MEARKIKLPVRLHLSRIILVLLLLLICTHFCLGKNIKGDFVLEMKLDNCASKYFTIIWKDREGNEVSDTIRKVKNGTYFFRTNKIRSAVLFYFYSAEISFNHGFAAPDYHLYIKADASNTYTFGKTLQVSGQGSEPYLFYHLLDSILVVGSYTINLREVDQSIAKAKYSRFFKMKDSLIDAVFATSLQDPNLVKFKGIMHLDTRFELAASLLRYAKEKNLSGPQEKTLFEGDFDPGTLEVFEDSFLISEVYRDFIVNDYLGFVLRQNASTISSTNEDFSDLATIMNQFTGKSKEYSFYRVLQNKILLANDIVYLKTLSDSFKVYSRSFTNQGNKIRVILEFARRERKLDALKLSKQAPPFLCRDLQGKLFRLKELRGKVIYIDFWASWCAPCRAETPFLKKIYNKYKNDSRFVIISIAVHDPYYPWRKAVGEENVPWKQLHDSDNSAHNAFDINVIPRFILVTKEGSLADLDAPRPSEFNKLVAKIDKELGKAILGPNAAKTNPERN